MGYRSVDGVQVYSEETIKDEVYRLICEINPVTRSVLCKMTGYEPNSIANATSLLLNENRITSLGRMGYIPSNRPWTFNAKSDVKSDVKSDAESDVKSDVSGRQAGMGSTDIGELAAIASILSSNPTLELVLHSGYMVLRSRR